MGHRVPMRTVEISRRLLKALNRGDRVALSVAPRRTVRLKALAVLMASFLIASSAAQSTHTTVRHHKVEEQDPATARLTEAEANIEKQDYSAAEPLLKKYLETYPDSYAGWYDLGYVYQGLGRKDEAIAAYQKSVAAKSDVFESNLNLGLALAAAGRPDAEGFLRAATKLKPSSGNEAASHKRAWMALGHLLESAKPEQAAEAYQQAAALDAKDPESHLMAGSLLEKDRPADAEKEYQQALSVAPNNSDALTALTNLYMRQKRFADAESLLRKLVVLEPNDAAVHFQLGRMFIISDKKDEAAAELEAGLKLDPRDAKAQRDLADLYSDMGKFEQARQGYSALLSTNPNDPGLHHGLGRVLLKQKKFAEAEQELAKSVQLKPDLGEAYGDLAIAANENKDYLGAIKAMDMRSKFIPDTPMSNFLRATAYDHLRDVKQAAKYYHQFLEAAAGKYPDQEWQAKHRLIAIEPHK
jgi:tetratricopeptide (TPR) repeat protein